MLDLMSKTKKQLVELVQNLEREKTEWQKELAALKEAEAPASWVKAPQISTDEFERLTQTNEHLKNGYSSLAEAHDRLILENADLVKACEELERKMTETETQLGWVKTENASLQKEVDALAARLDRTGAILKVFTEDGDKGIVLLDQDFKICFTNQPAGRFFANENGFGSGNQDFLSLINGEDPKKIEKKFQKAIQRQKKGKLKKMSLQSGQDTTEKVHIKFLPVLFKNQPGLQLEIE